MFFPKSSQSVPKNVINSMKNTNNGQGLIFGGFQVFQILTNPDFTRVLTSFKFPQVPLTSEKFN